MGYSQNQSSSWLKKLSVKGRAVLGKRARNEAASRCCAQALCAILLAAVFYSAAAGSDARQAAGQPGGAATERSRQNPRPAAGQARNSPAGGYYQLSPEKYQKAVAYSRAGYTLYFVSVGWGFLALLLLLRWGVIARLRDVAERVSSKVYLQAFVFV